ncbi:hypothetical protein [Tunturiibacter gelidoferens]|uniref:Uncharacterized protein n=1 Tax=Tunturiibacter gelidiferens TaxID=3069689 RepID=A0A9X0QK47_9BACT|nr:hypothetical protein [Edaphobacter lichenicola]MBB5331789.1 hypothetical protein [Edaphobacter lichenicola]
MTQMEAVVLAISTLVVGALAVYVTLRGAPPQPPSQTVINNNNHYYNLTTPQWPSENQRGEAQLPALSPKSALTSPASSFAEE